MLHVAAGALSAQQNLYKVDHPDDDQVNPPQLNLKAATPAAPASTAGLADPPRDAWDPQVIEYDKVVTRGCHKDIQVLHIEEYEDSLNSDYDDDQLTPSESDASTGGASSPVSHYPDGGSPTEEMKEYDFSGYFAKRFINGNPGEQHDISKRRHLIETVGDLSQTYRSYDDISEQAIEECTSNEATHITGSPTNTTHTLSQSNLRDLDAIVGTAQKDNPTKIGQSMGLKLYIPWNMDEFDRPLQEGNNDVLKEAISQLYSFGNLGSGCKSSERGLHEQVGITCSEASSSTVIAAAAVGVPRPPPSPTTLTSTSTPAHAQDHVVHDYTSTHSTHLVSTAEEGEDHLSPPLSPSFDLRACSRFQQARSSIDYNFELWEEPYFDFRTGERILSTIYEFELSADEESESEDELLFRKGSRRASILVAPYEIWSVMEGGQDEGNGEEDRYKYKAVNVKEVVSDENVNNAEQHIYSGGVTVVSVDENMSKLNEQDSYEGVMENTSDLSVIENKAIDTFDQPNLTDTSESIMENKNPNDCELNVNADVKSNVDLETDNQIDNVSGSDELDTLDIISHLEYSEKIKLINEAPESAIEKIVSIMEGNEDIYSVIDEIVEIVINENKALGLDIERSLAGQSDVSHHNIQQDTPSPAPTEQDAILEETSNVGRREEERIQKDRCLEVYPETLRQRQRAMIQSNNKVDIKNWSSGGELQTTPNKSNKKFLPSVKALRNQFETGKSNNNRADASPSPTNTSTSPMPVLSRRSSTSTSSLASSSLEKASSTNSLNSQGGSTENLLGPSIENGSPRENGNHQLDEEPVEPIFNQFKQVDEELRQLMKRPPTTSGWNPRPLLRRLYYVPEAPKIQSRGTTYVNIEGYLEKLPSGRKKATFWNAWKRRYFVAKDGVLYYYQNNQSEKPSMKMSLMGGKVECMEPNMIGVDDGRGDKAGVMLGIDDGKGHYVVVRCSSRQEAERWRRALETHNVEDFASQYVQPWPIPTNPTLLRDTLVVDLGSASVRAGVLASNPTLPQLFFPSVVSTARGTRQQTWGFDSLSPDIRANSTISFPLRPSHKISKYSVDLSTVSSLLQKTFAELNVDPKNYHLQISVPRILNTNTQAELLRILFEKFDVKSVNLTHQSILALYAYNATSGIVVDIGERMDIVPVIDGYIVDGGVSRVPYGGHRILDHLRQFLYQNNVSLVNEVESYLIRYVLENACYCANHYNTEKARCTNNSDNFEKNVDVSEFFKGQPCPYANIPVDFGRFQATEGLFNPDAWGLDHPGLHKLVHKAIQECSMDIRKEMSRSIFLSGGVSQLPGLTERLTTELDNLTPPAIRPKVHASPYSYHAAYLGGCVLAESPAFIQSRITREDWSKHGNMALRKWSL